MNPETLAIALGILLVAYLVRGITGFGSGLLAVPLLAHILPLQFVVPLVLVLDFSASLTLSRHARKYVRWDEIIPLLPSTIVGILLGVALLVSLPREPLLTALGLFVMFFGVRYVFDIQGSKAISRLWAVPTGLAGGLISALFGTGGPPYVIYLSHRMRDKAQLRASFSGLFLFDGALRIAGFIYAGLFIQEKLLTAIALGIPVMAGGLYLGHKIHLGIGNRQMLMLIGLLLVTSGLSLLWKAWG